MASSTGGGMTTGFPLGLASMGITLLIWSAYLGGWLPDPQVVIAFAIFVGGIGMLAAGIVAFRDGAAFGGAANIGLSAFWFGTAYFFTYVLPSAKNVSVDTAWAMVPWIIFTGILTVGISRMKVPLLTIAMGLFFLTIVLLGVFSAFHTGMIVLRVAGVAGILSSLAAFVVFYQRMWQEAV
jgi:succinate-acetate transporter protein